MDPLIIILAICIAIIIGAIIKRLTTTAGEVGENAVAKRLKGLSRDKYFIINDLMIEKSNGNTSQIDHVVVSPYGVFVIETKNISGYIYGSEYSKRWTRQWRGYKRGGIYGFDNMTFDNPVLQNGVHVKALFEQLKEFHPKFIPIIVFSPQATLKVDVQEVDVVYWTEIKSVIKSYDEEVMSIEKAHEIFEFLRSLNIKDKARRREHTDRVVRNKQYYNIN
jgi:hypothetical protein